LKKIRGKEKSYIALIMIPVVFYAVLTELIFSWMLLFQGVFTPLVRECPPYGTKEDCRR